MSIGEKRPDLRQRPGALWPSLAVTACISGAGFVGVGLVVVGALLTALGGRSVLRPADLEADAA